jgi:hypothetical protein
MPGREHLGPREEPFSQQRVRDAFEVVKSLSGAAPDQSEESKAFEIVMTRLLQEEQRARFRPQPKPRPSGIFRLFDPAGRRREKERQEQEAREADKEKKQRIIEDIQRDIEANMLGTSENPSIVSPTGWEIFSGDGVEWQTKKEAGVHPLNLRQVITLFDGERNSVTGIYPTLAQGKAINPYLEFIIVENDANSSDLHSKHRTMQHRFTRKPLSQDYTPQQNVVGFRNIHKGSVKFLHFFLLESNDVAIAEVAPVIPELPPQLQD